MSFAFTTKARTVELLGRSQIRDGVTAISELIKNTYDADSDYVEMHFGTGASENDAIIIADHGCGMTEKDFVENWLVLGATGKRDRSLTPKGRPVLGAKGVGRLAVDALGSQLLLFTKSADSGWIVAYINWEMFQNSRLFLDDIRTPIAHIDDLLPETLTAAVRKLQSAQAQNLAVDGWYDLSVKSGSSTLPGCSEVELFLKEQEGSYLPVFDDGATPSWFDPHQKELLLSVHQSINALNPNFELIALLLSEIQSGQNGTGTLLYVTSLRSDWDLRKEENKPTIASLSRTLSWLFEDGSAIESHIYCNGQDIKSLLEKDFSEYHYGLYDIKFSGTVRRDEDDIARFHGVLHMRGVSEDRLKPVNDILADGLPLMDQLAGKSFEYCGPYDIEVCHVEGDQWMSGLPPDNWSEIMGLISEENGIRKGGIRVYRDNVRVLPYGEPGNDFLQIEYRRTLRAGRWIFSHRNTFGRIHLTREANSNLQEKTSREGFVEDKYYHYFRSTCVDLLIKMASEFLNNESSFNLRNDYVVPRAEEHDAQVELEKKQKEERKRLQEEIRRLYDKMEAFSAKDFVESLGYTRIVSSADTLDENARPLELSRTMDELRHLRAGISAVETQRLRPEMTVFIQGGVRLRKRIEQHNEEIDEILRRTIPRLEHLITRVKGHLDRKLADRDLDREYAESVLEHCSSEVEACVQILQEMNGDIGASVSAFERMVADSKSHVDDLLSADYFRSSIGKLQSRVASLRKRISDDFNVMGMMSDLESLRRDVDNLREETDAYPAAAHQEFTETLHSLGELHNVIPSKKMLEANDLFVMEQASRADDLIELAGIGLASDVLVHEMDQYMGHVQRALASIREFDLDDYGSYWVKMLESGAKAITTRLAAIQPMTKSRHSYRESIDLKDEIDGICALFTSQWSRNEVILENDVPGGVSVRTSLSRFFPSICNILDNMSHWVLLSNKKRIIRIAYTDGDLTFSNSGPGIREETARALFTPFFSTREGGRGLGLYLSRASLRAMDWDLVLKEREDTGGLGGPVFAIVVNPNDRGEM